MTEDEDNLQGGDILFVFRNLSADESEDDDGFMAESAVMATLNGHIIRSSFLNDDDGVQIEQADAGAGLLVLVDVTTDGNGDDALNVEGDRDRQLITTTQTRRVVSTTGRPLDRRVREAAASQMRRRDRSSVRIRHDQPRIRRDLFLLPHNDLWRTHQETPCANR